jgi:hypothetical protein
VTGLNDNQGIDDLIFLILLIVHGYRMIFNDENLAVHSSVHKESTCFGISRLSLIVYDIKAFNCFYF